MLSALSWVGDASGARQLQHCTLNPPPSIAEIPPSSSPSIYFFQVFHQRSSQRCVGCCCFLFWQKLHCQQWMHQNKKLINNTHRQQFSKHTSCFKRHDTDLLSKFQANSSQKKIFATSCPLNIAFFTNVCCLFHGILYLFLNSTNGSLKNNFFSTEGKLRHG